MIRTTDERNICLGICFRCGSEDHLIAKFPKPPKKTRKDKSKYVLMKMLIVHATTEKNNSDQKIYASMARMSGNDKYPSRNFVESLQLTNWILDSGAMCRMTPEASDFISGLLEYTDKHIEVADGHHVMEKLKVQVRIKMCDNNGDPFIATLHNVLLEPDLWNK